MSVLELHPNLARVRRAAEERGIAIELRRFDRTTRTAPEAAKEIGCALGQIIKSLVFIADGQPILALCSGTERIDEAKLRARLGAEDLRRANAAEARLVTGYPIGGTPPFGHTRRLRVLIDRGLLRYDELWAGAGLPEAVLRIGAADLVRGSGGEVASIATSDALAVARCDLVAAARLIANGALSSGSLVEACLERAVALEPRLHAFAWLDAERARRLAAEADRGRSEGAPRAWLQGVPVGVKDIIDTAGVPTECGSALFAGRVPPRSADVVLALERAGAIVLGKTVTTELAFFQPGPTTNPYDLTRTPGGSSMGSAAAVAAGIVPAAVGTQTNGSVIRPAAFCGVVGFKPSAGLLPRGGILTFSESLDQVGAFARSVEGAAWLVAVMAGQAPARWPLRVPAQAPRFAVARTAEWRLADPAMHARFDADLDSLRAAGAGIEEPPLPEGLDSAVPVHRAIMAFEAARSLGQAVGSRPELVSVVIRALLDEGAGLAEADFRAALRERQRLVEAFTIWASTFDAVLTPPALGEAPGLETTGDPRFCTRWTLVGAPALTLPTGHGPSGLPLGLQLVGAPGDDRRLLAAAGWVEGRLPAPKGPPL